MGQAYPLGSEEKNTYTEREENNLYTMLDTMLKVSKIEPLVLAGSVENDPSINYNLYQSCPFCQVSDEDILCNECSP